MAVFRENPYSRFNFLVNLGTGDEGSVRGGFAEVTGLSLEVQVIEYRNGNERRNAPRKLPGLAKVGEITLKRGVIGSNDLFDWLRTARDGMPERRDVTVQLQSEDRTTVAQEWRLLNAWPTRYRGPELSATTNDVAIEELVLTCEGLDIV
ncbi:MAG: phage tail protein [Kiloniellales bacterium]